jgi:hypothetical protein
MAERFENILNECIDLVLRGESVEQCLARYPEQMGELEPLLRTAVGAREAADVEPRPEFKAQVRYQTQSRLSAKGQKAEHKRMPVLGWAPRWAMVVAAILLVVVLAGSGTVAASSDSLPGDTLYPVKTATERVQMFFAFSDVAKAKLQAKFAGRRVQEMARLAERGDIERLEGLAVRFKEHLARIEGLSDQIVAADSQNAAKIAELEEILNRNMARDDAVLEAAYSEAPSSLRPAIQQARMRLMQGYQEAIANLSEKENQQPAYGDGEGSWGQSGSDGTGLLDSQALAVPNLAFRASGVTNGALLSDAEVAEDSVQKVSMNRFTGDLSKGIEGYGQIDGDEVVRRSGINSSQCLA